MGLRPTNGGENRGAPEQLRRERVDAGADIYAAGAVLYEMAAGRRPFADLHGPQLIAAILQRAPPAPSAVARVSPGLENVVQKAIDKDPDRRCQSARELAVDLERLTTPSAAVALPKRRPMPRWILVAANCPRPTWLKGCWRRACPAGSTRMHQPTQAIQWLQATIDNGFPCDLLFEHDRNLDPLRKGPRFQELMARLKKNYDYYRATFSP